MSNLTPLQIATIENIRVTFKDHDPVGVKVFDALIEELTKPSAAQPTPEPRKVIFEHICTLNADGHPYMHQIFNLAPNDCGIKAVGKFHGKPIRVTVYENEVKA